MFKTLAKLWWKVRGIMGKQDLKSNKLDGLDWRPESTAASLDKVRDYVTGKVRTAVDWYFAGKQTKKWAAWFFRGGIILLTAAAGILPLANEIHQNQQTDRLLRESWMERTNAASLTQMPSNAPAPDLRFPPPRARRLFDPVWSAVLLAIAGTLLALDRFHGATSGWVRYILTAQQLTEAVDDFELAFEAQKLGWAGAIPKPEQARAALELAQKFVRQANGIVHDETRTWAAEFAEALKQIDEQLKVAGQVKRQSAIQVTVTNGNECEGGWKLIVDGGLPDTRIGKEASVEVQAGLHTVRAIGTIGQKPVQAEKAISVGLGEIQRCELKLEG